MIDFFCPQPQKLDSLRSGPLGPHLEGFAALLARQGYCQIYRWRKLRLAAALGQWLEKRRLHLCQLDEQQANAFLQRWQQRHRFSGDSYTLTMLLQHLRQNGVIPAIVPPVEESGFMGDLIRDYEQFLRQERGLLPVTIHECVRVAQRFLRHRFPKGQIQLRQLGASDAADFILRVSPGYGHRYLQSLTSRLRVFFRFLLQRGHMAAPLVDTIPTVAARQLSHVPRYMETRDVEKTLGSCDRRTKIGKRDYAVLLLLARLGLRASEVARLGLEDVDWRAGEVCVRGKGQRLDRLPLPKDVGEAIASYLKIRPCGATTRRVFLRDKAPYEGLVAETVGSVVDRALTRVRLHPPHRGAHLLRHSLATRMLQSGVSMAQISQVLRHQSAQTTMIYAKVDLNALRLLAQPWPGGAQ
jgi:site-specific recombinase XerC